MLIGLATMILLSLSPLGPAAAKDDLLAIDNVTISPSIGQSHKVEIRGTYRTDFPNKKTKLSLVIFGPLQTRSQLDGILANPNQNLGTVHNEISTVLTDIQPEAKTDWSLKFNGEKLLGQNASGVFVFGVIKAGSNLQSNTVQPWFYHAPLAKKTKVIFLTQLSVQNTHLADGQVRFINRDAGQLSRLNDLIDGSATNVTFLKDEGINYWISDLQKSALKPAADQVAGKFRAIKTKTQLQVFNHTNLQGLFSQSPGDVPAVLQQSGFSAGKNIYYLPKFGRIDSQTLVNLANYGNIIPILSNTFVLGTPNGTATATAKVNNVPAIVYDATTSRCFSKSTSDQVSNCVSANIAMMTAESPYSARTIAILTPPFWSAESGELTKLARTINSSRWAKLIPLDQATNLDAMTNHYVTGQSNQFSKGLVRGANRLVKQARVLGTAISDESFIAGYESVRLRSFSEILPKPQSGKYFLRTNKELLERTRAKIAIRTSSRITVASTKTDIPLTISNESGYPIKVKARLASNSASQFKTVTTNLIDIPNNQRVTVSITVELAGTGNVPVTANLLNAKNQKLKVAQKITLTSSSYQSLARTLVWGACGLLLLFAIVNVARKRWGDGTDES